MDDRPEVEPQAMRARLLARRAELRRLIEAGAESARPVELDQTRQGRLSRMDALQQQAMAQESERRRVAELQRIDSALRRIEEDEYGFCQGCGEPIAARRLELDPTALLCIVCAEKASP
jgi:DnaK suppressor protein